VEVGHDLLFGEARAPLPTSSESLSKHRLVPQSKQMPSLLLPTRGRRRKVQAAAASR